MILSFTYTLVAVQQGIDVEQCGHSHRTGDDAVRCTWAPETPLADIETSLDFYAVVEPHRARRHPNPPTGCLVIIKSCYNICPHGVPNDEGCVACIQAETGEEP